MADSSSSRRGFLKTAAAAVGGLVIGGAGGYLANQGSSTVVTKTQVSTVTTAISTQTQQTTQASASSLGSIKFTSALSNPNLTAMWSHMANDLGYYAKNGLSVTTQGVAGGPRAVQAVLSGDTQIGEPGWLEAIGGRQAGGKIKTIMTLGEAIIYILAVNSKITSVQGLKGASIGCSSLNSLDYFIALYVLGTAGLTAKDVNFVATGSPADRLKALIAGKVDASMQVIQDSFQINQQSNLKILLDNLQPSLPFFIGMDAVIVTEDYLASNRKIVVAVVKSLLETNRALQLNKQLYIKEGLKIVPGVYTPDQILQVENNLLRIGHSFNVNGGLNLQRLQQTIDWYFNTVSPTPQSQRNVTAQSMVDLTVLDEVLSDIDEFSAWWDIPDWRESKLAASTST